MSTIIERDANGKPYVAGDDMDIERDVGGISLTDPLIKAWLTIKASLGVADPGTLQKVITTSAVPGTGQIAQDGSTSNGDGTASIIFELTKTETATLGTAIRYYYDIQVKTQSGKIFTPEVGRLSLSPGITDATT